MRGECALPEGSRLLVAVSGGADSTALLLGLHSVAPEFGLSLHAAHLHHGLRGPEADADLEFVSALCARLGVPLAAARWDCRARMRRRGLTGQAGLRVLRREFLAQVARRTASAAIATAHTADDQLETLLLRLMRGSGLAGLGGIHPRRGSWIRPLLAAPRAEVEADLRSAVQVWREDSSNQDPRYARSRVRHDVIPAMLRAMDRAGSGRIEGRVPDATSLTERTQSPRAGLARRVAAAARELRGAWGIVARRSARVLAQVEKVHGREFALDSRRLGSYPATIQRTVFRLLWQRPGHTSQDLTERHLNALQSLVATPRRGSRVDLPGGWRAVCDRGMIVMRRGGGHEPPPRPRAVPARGHS